MLRLRALTAVALLTACGAEPSAPALPWPAASLGAVPAPTDNPPTPARAELGRMLFHDPILSADRAVACVTCHGENWGLSDGLRFSVGVYSNNAAGLSRRGPHRSRRNAPSLWNAGYRTSLFWDGRAPSLEAQVLGPITDPDELARDPAELVRDLAAVDAYVALFRAAFPEDSAPVTQRNLQRALASFVRTIVSDRAPYDLYARGDALAMTDAELRGMNTFARAGCAGCHAPPLFASETFAPRAAVLDGAPAPEAPPREDLGRFEVTGRDEDRGRYRTPSLRNLRESAPYFHDGSSDSLDEAVARESVTRGAPLSERERRDVVTFLHQSLMDKTRMPAYADRVPSGLPVPSDGYRPRL